MNGKVPKKFMKMATKRGSKGPLTLEEYIIDGKIPKMM
jgi:hypothetical protein